MADYARQAAGGEEGSEVAPWFVGAGGEFKSWMRRARSISLLIHSTASAIASKTAASTNHGQV